MTAVRVRVGGDGNGNNGNGNNTANMRPSQHNHLLADNGDVRASKMIGNGVFNDRNQNLGSVNDVLIGRNGVWAIVSTNNKRSPFPSGTSYSATAIRTAMMRSCCRMSRRPN